MSALQTRDACGPFEQRVRDVQDAKTKEYPEEPRPVVLEVSLHIEARARIVGMEQAEQEELAAQSQELQRRQELNRALAANVAALSTAGISGEGTPASLALESARQAGLSEMTIDLSERLRRASLERQARQATQIAGIQAASTLLGGASRAGELGLFDKESYE